MIAHHTLAPVSTGVFDAIAGLLAAIALPHALVSLILAQNQLPHLRQLEISFALIGNA